MPCKICQMRMWNRLFIYLEHLLNNCTADLIVFFLVREQVLVLDEADRILDVGFKKELNAIISQLPKHRQTFLFSATQTKSVQDLARLSLKDPEYLSVHEESESATPNLLQQTAITVPLDQKFDMLVFSCSLLYC